jgi:ribose transport system substrate-binding protein
VDVRFPFQLGKVRGLLVLASLAALVSACGSSSPSSSSSSSQSKTIRLGLVLPDLTNQTIDEIYTGAQAAAKSVNVSVLEGGASDTPTWLSACQRIVASNIQILAYDTLDAKGTSSCIQEANKMGIKVICIFACTTLGTNNVTLGLNTLLDGEQIGDWMAMAVNNHGDIATLNGVPGDDAAQSIDSGFRMALSAKCPSCVLVANLSGGTSQQTGLAAAEPILIAHPKIVGFFGMADDVALGVVAAVKQAGLTGKVQIAGHNGECPMLQDILKGTAGFTQLLAGQPFGQIVVSDAIAMVAGKTVASINNLTPIAMTTAIAKATLAGTAPAVVNGVDVKALLTTAQNGCSTS